MGCGCTKGKASVPRGTQAADYRPAVVKKAGVPSWFHRALASSRRQLERWAKKHCPDVPAVEVGAVVKALGEISYDEAQAALSRWQAAAAKGVTPAGAGQ